MGEAAHTHRSHPLDDALEPAEAVNTAAAAAGAADDGSSPVSRKRAQHEHGGYSHTSASYLQNGTPHTDIPSHTASDDDGHTSEHGSARDNERAGGRPAGPPSDIDRSQYTRIPSPPPSPRQASSLAPPAGGDVASDLHSRPAQATRRAADTRDVFGNQAALTPARPLRQAQASAPYSADNATLKTADRQVSVCTSLALLPL